MQDTVTERTTMMQMGTLKALSCSITLMIFFQLFLISLIFTKFQMEG